MAIRIDQFEKELNQKRGEFEHIKKNLAECERRISLNKERQKYLIEAQKIIQDVAVSTQSSIVFRINEIVNRVIQAVFPEYSFELKYEVHRNKSEASLKFYCGGEEIDILSDAGGVMDIASTGLRFALWSMTNKANVILLDENLKFLSADLQHRGAEILKSICVTLGIQIIFVSHIPAMTQYADNVIHISKSGKYSTVQWEKA